MTEEYLTLSRVRTHLGYALRELEYLDKLPRIRQNLHWMLGELGEYIKLQKELDE